MWSIIDNPAKAATDEDRYFGLIRLDGSEKPAAAIVEMLCVVTKTMPSRAPGILSD